MNIKKIVDDSRTDLPTALLFLGGAGLLSFAAWMGSKPAVVTLGVLNLSLGVLVVLRGKLTREILEHARLTLEHWKIDTKCANSLMLECGSMIQALRESDPEKALIFEERIQKIWVDQYVSHNPNIGEEILRRANSAETN